MGSNLAKEAKWPKIILKQERLSTDLKRPICSSVKSLWAFAFTQSLHCTLATFYTRFYRKIVSVMLRIIEGWNCYLKSLETSFIGFHRLLWVTSSATVSFQRLSFFMVLFVNEFRLQEKCWTRKPESRWNFVCFRHPFKPHAFYQCHCWECGVTLFTQTWKFAVS